MTYSQLLLDLVEELTPEQKIARRKKWLRRAHKGTEAAIWTGIGGIALAHIGKFLASKHGIDIPLPHKAYAGAFRTYGAAPNL